MTKPRLLVHDNWTEEEILNGNIQMLKGQLEIADTALLLMTREKRIRSPWLPETEAALEEWRRSHQKRTLGPVGSHPTEPTG